MAAPPTRTKRTIVSHRKSRQGCRNCKLRKVKCDESRPRCSRCHDYGILCNFDRRHLDLQLSSTGAAAIDMSIVDWSPVSRSRSKSRNDESEADSTGSNRSGASQSGCTTENSVDGDNGRPTLQDVQILARFHSRTLPTLGSRRCTLFYQDIYDKLISSNAFLFHIALAVTLVHDTVVRHSLSPSHAETTAWHWSRGASLLNQVISQPICDLSSSTRDAMWACSALLGCLAFSVVGADTVKQAWPLKHSDAGDLDWLNMCEGKTAIFKVSDPLRHDSLFAPMREEMMHFMSFRTDLSVAELRQALHADLVDICVSGANPDDGEINHNPCWAPMSLLAQLMPLECNQETYLLFLGFFRTLGAGFKKLLADKDPAALLLLLQWYAKSLAFDAWWLAKRASLESRAIGMYLLEHHADDIRIPKLVDHIQRHFGTCQASERIADPLDPSRLMHLDMAVDVKTSSC